MKKITFGAILCLHLILPTVLNAQSDSLFERDLVVAVFKTFVSLDTTQITVDSVIIMVSPDYGKIWVPGDNTGFTFIKKDGSWRFLVDAEISQKIQKINPYLLLGVLKKLKTLQKK